LGSPNTFQVIKGKSAMIIFRAVHISQWGGSGWAVERNGPEILTTVVSPVYSTREAAEREAGKLNEKEYRRHIS